MKRTLLCAVGGALLVGVTGAANADTSQADLLKKVDALQARVTELESKQNTDWLSERRADEVKALVKDALADADTRASLLGNAAGAGYANGHFFLASEDGAFLMNISGQVQFRYIVNLTDRDAGDDEALSGFQFGEGTNIGFSGHISSPKISYHVLLRVDPDENQVVGEEITVGYAINDQLSLWLGETKAPLLKEEIISSGDQLAIERSLVNEVFTAGAVQGLGLVWVPTDMVKVSVAVSDGVRSGEALGNNSYWVEGSNDKPFNEDDSDFAITARVDVKLAGGWEQANGFTAWPGDPLAAFVGAAIHAEWEGGGDGDSNGRFYVWTVDGMVKCENANLFAAFIGASNFDDSETEYDLYGAVVQAGYNIAVGNGTLLEPFVRYEWLDVDGIVSQDNINIVTAGLNWYLNKQRTKVSVDVVWALDQIPDLGDLGVDSANADLLGLVSDSSGREDQAVLRAQMQVQF